MSSVPHARAVRKQRMLARRQFLHVRGWDLWSEARPVVIYVLTVDVLALAVAGGTAWLHPVSHREWVWVSVLTAASLLHLELSRAIEARRDIASGGTMPYTNLKALWVFAALALVPLPLVLIVITLSYSYDRIRVNPRSHTYRKAFSAATLVLTAAITSALIEAMRPGTDHQLFTSARGLAVLTAAGLVYWFVNYALVVGVILIANPANPSRQAFGHPTDQFLELAGIALGVIAAALLILAPWLLALLMAAVLAVHLGLLLPQFQHAARTDLKTGLADPVFWHEMADKELARAARQGTPLSLVMLDLDHFKQVNDRYGHVAGDEVLQAVSHALKQDVRDYDLIGRFGGEEFAVLLPGVDTDEAIRTAERLRQRVARLRISVQTRHTDGSAVVEHLTMSAGTATFPIAAQHLDHLVLAADTALYAAKELGRDQVHTAPATLTVTRQPSESA